MDGQNCVCVCVNTYMCIFIGSTSRAYTRLSKGYVIQKRLRTPGLGDLPVPTSMWGSSTWHLRRRESWNSACLLLFHFSPSCFDNTEVFESSKTRSIWLVKLVCLKSANTSLDLETKPQLLPAHQCVLPCCNQTPIQAVKPKWRHFPIRSSTCL